MPPPSHPVNASVADFVDGFGAAMTAAGLPRMPSHVFAALLADEDGRMTAAEIAEALEVSPAAVSGAVRYLANVGLLRRERQRGSRRDVFVVQDDAWHDLLLSKDALYGPIIAALALGVQAPDAGPGARARIALSLEFLEFVRVEMDGLLARWDARRVLTLPKSGGSAS